MFKKPNITDPNPLFYFFLPRNHIGLSVVTLQDASGLDSDYAFSMQSPQAVQSSVKVAIITKASEQALVLKLANNTLFAYIQKPIKLQGVQR